MKILALEFSSEQRSVAVSRAGVPPAESVAASATPRTLNAFHLIDTALRQAALEREDIDCVAVGLGPGSYTGIRAAISIAQAWQLARGVQLLGLSSVDCLVAQAQAAGVRGRVSFAIDAQRNEFYLATYEMESTQPRLIEPLRLASFAEVSGRVKTGELLMGPEVDRRFPQAR